MVKCPVCDKDGWYYDPFPKIWKCPHCGYKDNSLFGKIFCFECGEFIRNPLNTICRGYKFYHKKCYANLK